MPCASDVRSLCSISHLIFFPEVAPSSHALHKDASPHLPLRKCFIYGQKFLPKPPFPVHSVSNRRHDLKSQANCSQSGSQPSELIRCCRTFSCLEKDKFEGVAHMHISKFTRRSFGARFLSYFALLPVTLDFSAKALSDPILRIEDVTPPITPAGKLPAIEERTIDLFEKNTYSVVNVFDASLRPQMKQTGMIEIPEGNGSGIVWDTLGHIVTNYHVIGSALSNYPSFGQAIARVTLLNPDGSQKAYPATLIGADKAKDLAVLKIVCPPGVLRPITLGQSSKLRVGQRCLAIGNPFGFDHTLTVGVVSGLNRDISTQVGGIISGGIQTDAAINPGNSGGPLLDSSGKVIGINTAIFTRSGTSAGVSFAIPIDTVVKTVPQLIMFGKVQRPGLNVQLAPDVVAKQLNVKSGALVLSAPNTSAAIRAGLVPTKRGLTGNIILGDVIVAVNNVSVKNATELFKLLDDYQVGDQVLLKVERNNSVVELSFRLEESIQ